MQVDIRQPMIQGSDREQLSQIRSYLFQLREQLQWAFENVEATASESKGGTTIIHQNTTQKVTRPPTDDEALETFAAIKSLIINSADIIKAYETSMSETFESRFVAQGDFDSYSKDTTTRITQNAERVETVTSMVETIESTYQYDIDDGATEAKCARIQTTQGYITAGFIDDSVYGIEMGVKKETDQSEYERSARFLPDGVFLYDGIAKNEGAPVASASLTNRRLTVDEVQALNKQQIGGFVDVISTNGDVTTRWVGGDES